MAKSYFPTLANQEEIKNKINGLTSGMNNHDAAWTPGRAAKLDNIQAVLNTPDGNTLAAWINAVNTNAASANTYAQQAVNSANNAYNIANQANQNAANAANQAAAALNAINANNNGTQYRYYPRTTSITNLPILVRPLKHSLSSVTVTTQGELYQLICKFYPECDGLINIYVDGTLSSSNTNNTDWLVTATLGYCISNATFATNDAVSHLIPHQLRNNNLTNEYFFKSLEHSWKIGDTSTYPGTIIRGNIISQTQGHNSPFAEETPRAILSIQVTRGVPLYVWSMINLSVVMRNYNGGATGTTLTATGNVTRVSIGAEKRPITG